MSEIVSLWPLWALFVSLAVLGAFLVLRSFVAFRQRHSRPLLLLSSGIAALAIGMPVSWTVMYFVVGNLFWCTMASTLTSLVGAGLLVASVQMRTA